MTEVSTGVASASFLSSRDSALLLLHFPRPPCPCLCPSPSLRGLGVSQSPRAGLFLDSFLTSSLSPRPAAPASPQQRPPPMARQQLFRALVSAQWVVEALRAPRAAQPLQLLDASWYLPKLGRDARREFEERHIPGAAFFDIDQCSDRTSPYDHMLPSASHFSEYVGRLGVGAATHVVIYDASDQGLYAAPRVWWMFRAFGHRTVSLLDGGLRNWLRQGLPLSSGRSRPVPTEFRATLDPAFVKTYEDIKENLESRRFQVVDARAAGRFRGTEPEPREGNRAGRRGWEVPWAEESGAPWAQPWPCPCL